MINSEPDHQGYIFRMEEREDGIPLAGIFWTYARGGSDFTKTDEILEDDVSDIAAPEVILDNPQQAESEIQFRPNADIVRNLDFAGIRRLIPQGTSIEALIKGLRHTEPELTPIGSKHWVHRVFNETYFRARPPSIGKAAREEASFVFEALDLSQGERVFDAGCGYGRLAIPLSELGAEVVAMDISVAMTSKALAFSREAQVKLDVLEGDFRHCHYVSAFDAVVCADTSFGYYSDADNLSTLQAFRDTLKPHGKLYLEVVNRDASINQLPGRTWWEGRACLVQEDSEFNERTSRVRVKRLVVTAEGGQDEHWVDLRLYSIHELMEMLDLVGFRVLETSGSLRTRGAFFVTHSHRIAIVAQRKD